MLNSIRFDPNPTNPYAATYECVNGTQLLLGSTEFFYNGSAWIGEIFCAGQFIVWRKLQNDKAYLFPSSKPRPNKTYIQTLIPP